MHKRVDGTIVEGRRYTSMVDKNAEPVRKNVRRLVTTWKELYRNFKSTYGNLCSYTAFTNYMPKFVKKARQRTDVCPVCRYAPFYLSLAQVEQC